MSLTINLHQLEKNNLKLQGTVSAQELEMDDMDELIHFRQPLHYDLEIQKDAENLLVQGKLRLDLDCECARCLKPYVHDIQLDEWTCYVPLTGEDQVPVINDSVDLTPFLREDIVLALPQHPVCGPKCPGISGQWQSSGRAKPENEDSKSSPWNELDKLEF